MSSWRGSSRRRLLQGVAGAVVVQTLPFSARATPAEVRAAMDAAFGQTAIQPGKVNVTLPALAENGNSVRLLVEVQHPMLADDYVRFIQVFAPANPLPTIARFEFTPHSGVALIETRVRLAGEQVITAVAGLSDGSLWSGGAHIVVTEAACLDALM